MQGHLSKDESERLIGFSSNASPAFVICGIGAMRKSIAEGVLLYVVMLLSAIIVGIIFGIKKEAHPRRVMYKTQNFSFTDTVERAGINTLYVCSYLLIFSALIGVLQAFFLKNSVIECYYIGADDVNDVISLISERFATLGREKVALKGKERALKRDVNAPIKTLEESLNVSQARLNIGLVCDTVMRDRDYYAMSVFNEIFGASSVSKLFINVREKQSLCYYCYSSLSSATGTMQIMCGIKSENREKAYTEIENQLQAMQRGAFDDDDIETAKRTMISGVLQTLDSPAAITAFKFRRFLADVEESVEEAIERINSVSRDEIIKAANKVRFDCVYFLSGNEEEDEWEDE
jgi:Zn-dependent M16 (insulinase) family peptidase